MTQFNPNENDPVDVEFTSYTAKNTKQKKSHPVLTIALSAIISTACGLGGGYFAVTHLGSPLNPTGSSVNYTNQKSPSKVTSVSSSDDGNGLTTAQVAAKASPSVVEIVTEITSKSYGMFGGTYSSEAAGSGVIISADGYIVTNNHVVEDANSISVSTYDGKEYTATLIGTDEKTDIAVIKVEASDLIPATIGDSSQVAAGDTAVVIGNPLGTLGGTVTDGIISAASREIVINNQAMELIQTNAEINSGNSGGGLFDGNGNLIGIVNAKDSGTTSSGATIEGIGFAIPINTAMDIVTQLMENGKVTNRATLGVYLQEVTQATAQYPAGLYITDIMNGSGAEKAGLQAYDRIVSADGEEVSSYTELSKILNTKSVGDTITLTIERSGKTMVFDITLTGALETSAIQTSSTLG